MDPEKWEEFIRLLLSFKEEAFPENERRAWCGTYEPRDFPKRSTYLSRFIYSESPFEASYFVTEDMITPAASDLTPKEFWKLYGPS